MTCCARPLEFPTIVPELYLIEDFGIDRAQSELAVPALAAFPNYPGDFETNNRPCSPTRAFEAHVC